MDWLESLQNAFQPPTVFFRDPAAASIPLHSLDATVLYKQKFQCLARCGPQSWDWQAHGCSEKLLMSRHLRQFC